MSTPNPQPPDPDGIDLDQVCDRASLVYCLQLLRRNLGLPSYSDLDKAAKAAGETGLPKATLSDIIGDNAQNSTAQITWNTMRVYLVGCGIRDKSAQSPWRAAWKRAFAPDRPAWQIERDKLLAEIARLTGELAAAQARVGQLATAVRSAEARAGKAEAALAAQTAPRLPDHLDQLRVKGDTCWQAGEYAAAAQLYRQMATQAHYEYGPTDRRTLNAQWAQLDAETQAYKKSPPAPIKGRSRFRDDPWPHLNRQREQERNDLDQQWQHLIAEHQRWLPNDRTTLQIRFRHAYWTADLFDAPCFDKKTSKARQLLAAVLGDCKALLPPNDRLTTQVAEYMNTEQKERLERANRPVGMSGPGPK